MLLKRTSDKFKGIIWAEQMQNDKYSASVATEDTLFAILLAGDPVTTAERECNCTYTTQKQGPGKSRVMSIFSLGFKG